MHYLGRPALEHADTDPLNAELGESRGTGRKRTVRGPAARAGGRQPLRTRHVAPWAGRVALAIALAVVMTWPLAARFDRAARLNFGDGEWSLWNVTWVAHALTTAPGRVFQANIFHPDHNALAYSEANIVTGALGVPFHLATAGSPYATHNGAMLTGLVLSVVFAWGFAAYLGASGPVAAFFAIAFTYCPYLFARTSHIQLMMTFGLPLSLWMFHRLVDAPSMARGAALGVALAQAVDHAQPGRWAADDAIGFLRTGSGNEIDFAPIPVPTAVAAASTTPLESKWVTHGWRSEARVVEGKLGYGVLATRSIVDTTTAAWALPAPLVALLLS